MEEQLYRKRFYLLETALGIWHDTPAIGCMQQQDVLIERHGPFVSEEQAVSERERLKKVRLSEIEKDREGFKDR